jgi:hypothetical protein
MNPHCPWLGLFGKVTVGSVSKSFLWLTAQSDTTD